METIREASNNNNNKLCLSSTETCFSKGLLIITCQGFCFHTHSLNEWGLFISHEIHVFASWSAFHFQAWRGQGLFYFSGRRKCQKAFFFFFFLKEVYLAKQRNNKGATGKKQTVTRDNLDGLKASVSLSCLLQKGPCSLWGCSVPEMSNTVWLSGMCRSQDETAASAIPGETGKAEPVKNLC